MKTPYFSVITTTHNRTQYLDICLESIKNQTFNNYEHVIVDGFSTDGTYEMVKKYKKDNPNIRINITQSKPKGISNAFNIGIKNSSGTFLLFINSDDFLASENSLKEIYDILRKNKAIHWLQTSNLMAFKNKVKEIGSKDILSHSFHFLHSFTFACSHQATVMHKDIFKTYGLFREDLKIGMDWNLFQRIIDKEDVYFSSIKGGVFRIHSNKEHVKNTQTYLITNLVEYVKRMKGESNIPILTGVYNSIRYSERVKQV